MNDALFRVERFGDGTIHVRERHSRALLTFPIVDRQLQAPIGDVGDLNEELLEAAMRYTAFVCRNWKLIS